MTDRDLAISLGRAAYNGYRVRTGGKTFDGREMPNWDDLPLGVQDAWCAAAAAVLRNVARHLNDVVGG